MKLPRSRLLLLLPVLASCSTAKNWCELRTAPMPIGRIYDSVQAAAAVNGYRPGADCDRGLGIWQSRWRERAGQNGHPLRTRLRVEIESSPPPPPDAWLVRWYIEQQMVEDLRHAQFPAESDWDRAGQDVEREQLFGSHLAQRLQPAAETPAR